MDFHNRHGWSSSGFSDAVAHTPDADETAWPSARVADHFGVTLRALRFYESRGLVVPRRAGNARLYDAEARGRLAVIVKAKKLGFTLSEIRELLAASAAGADQLPISRSQCVEQINLLERQKRQIEAALAELRLTYTGLYRQTLDRQSLDRHGLDGQDPDREHLNTKT